MGNELEETSPSAEKLAADAAAGAVSALKRDVGPLTDELRRELREGALEVGAAAAAGAFSMLVVEMAVLAATDALARRMRRSTAALVMSGALALGAIAAGTYAWRRRAALPGRRLLQRLFATRQPSSSPA
jgi:uncharacterized membrane protein